MARLQFCDYHNLVAILEKGEFNTDFHPVVDFIAASPLRIETTDEGTHILATVDGIQRTVSEASLRRNLKLRDEDGIVSIPDTELFENLTLMGPKSTGFNEFSINIATALLCLATNKTYNFSKMIFDGMVTNVHNKVSKFIMYPRFLTKCLRMGQFVQITHTHQYVVPFHTKKLFTTLWVNSPSFSGRIVPIFDTILVHQGEGSGTPTEPHHISFPEVESSHLTTSSIPLSSIPTAPIPTVTQPDTTPIIQYSRRARIAQSFALPTVADEPASPVRDVREGEACPTASGFITDKDRATIAKSSTLPHDSAPRVTSPTADEGKEEIGRLKERVQVLDDREGVATKQSGEDALIKGRSNNEGEAAAERISNDSEEIARVLTSMDATTVLAGEIDVLTGSGFILTVGPPATIISTGSEVGPTASPIVTKRKGKEVMVESDTPKKKKLKEHIDAQVARELEEQQEKEDMRINEQIARDAEVVRIHAEEEIQGMIDSLDKSNETIAKYLQEYQEFASELPLEKKIELISDLVKFQEHYTTVHKFQSQQRKPMTKKQKREYYMAMIKSNLGWRFKDFKGMTFEEIEVKFAEVWKQVEDFIPMGSKEESERLKRTGLNLEKEQVKKQKSSEEPPEIEIITKEFTEEKIKEMMQLVPVEDMYVQALQVKHPIIDWKVHSEDLLRQLDMEDLNQLWALVKEYLSIRPASSDKEMELWVELKRMYEPDPKDQLWTLTHNYMHAPVEWKLYDLSRVHHVTAKDKEIFMLVEDYLLRRGLALVMISYRLQVENYSQMIKDLLRKIYNIANTLRKQSD
nr:hypothetical protein [Tanacetum cinerariifolium]